MGLVRGGDEQALEKLAAVVMEELRRLARHYMRGQPVGHTLQATALVNEAWIRLVDQADVSWHDRAHFFGVSAQMMRWILVDAARARSSARRGGAIRHVNLDDIQVAAGKGPEVIALDDALNELAKMDPRRAKVIELRFFGGLSVEETAEVLSVSPDTVVRDWKIARAWLTREIRRGGPHDESSPSQQRRAMPKGKI